MNDELSTPQSSADQPDSGQATDQATRSGMWRVAVPVMALGAGLLFGTSASLAYVTDFGEDPVDLPSLIQQRADEVETLSGDASSLREEVDQLTKANDSSTQQVSATDQADALAPSVGLGPITGPGVTVTLDDAGYTLETLPNGFTVDDVVVHQQDVQGVVNALWAGGAEGMMIQGQRIVGTSAIRCVGNTLYLQGRVYSPPYTITAIGDPAGMSSALVQDPIVANYRGWAQELGLGYLVESKDDIEMPAYSGSFRPEHVEVVTDPDVTRLDTR
ncbi:DUF881 domain-containing protein [Ornithinimicrobium sp. Arc0846-15]|nr:DUF881 domain-containing protein [Ornithinimicrobium laminariae]